MVTNPFVRWGQNQRFLMKHKLLASEKIQTKCSYISNDCRNKSSRSFKESSKFQTGDKNVVLMKGGGPVVARVTKKKKMTSRDCGNERLKSHDPVTPRVTSHDDSSGIPRSRQVFKDIVKRYCEKSGQDKPGSNFNQPTNQNSSHRTLQPMRTEKSRSRDISKTSPIKISKISDPTTRAEVVYENGSIRNRQVESGREMSTDQKSRDTDKNVRSRRKLRVKIRGHRYQNIPHRSVRANTTKGGIDIRSETGVMKPLFGGTGGRVDDRNELARLRLYVKQLEARVDSGVSSSYEDDAKLENLQKENKMLQEEKTSISRKFARLQDYLTTLPTVNEYSKLQEQLAQLTEENKNLQEEQTRVTESSKDSKQKDVDLKKYQKKCTEMRDSIQKLEKQNTLLKSQNANQAKQELQKVEQEKSKMEKKMEQLKKEIAVLSEQKESTKSLVGGYYEKFNNEQEKTKILTQSLDKSVTEVGDLKAELDRRSHQEQELQGRISDLERELEAAILKLEQFESKENRDVENSELLMAEYNAAFQDLNSVVEVCQMRAQGQQLDISLLLGLGSSPRPSSKEDLTVEAQLRNIHTLRSNIENIRTLLSDLYAEDIGSQCPTQ